MADAIFSWFKKNIANCSIDLNNDTIKVMLVTALSAPDQNAHTKHLNIPSAVTGPGYAAGRTLHANMDIKQDHWIEGVYDRQQRRSANRRRPDISRSGDGAGAFFTAAVDVLDDATAPRGHRPRASRGSACRRAAE
jgi:hypothetical protein